MSGFGRADASLQHQSSYPKGPWKLGWCIYSKECRVGKYFEITFDEEVFNVPPQLLVQLLNFCF